VTRVGLAALCALLAACGEPSGAGGPFRPTSARLLSTGSPTKDEDPSILLARDSSVFVAWFSDRGGNNDIYLTRTTDGASWSTPVRVTTDPGGDFYPTLMQDGAGTFHLTWFRWTAPFRGHIMYNSSADGLTWSPAAEVQVTATANVDDWVPTIGQAANGDLLVYFVSDLRDTANHTTDTYVSRRPSGSMTWDTAVVASGINSATEHDHLPVVARTAGSMLVLVWMRYDTTEALPFRVAKSHIWYASSANGLSWTAPQRITNDTDLVVHAFPALYLDEGRGWSFVWLSNRLGSLGVWDLPIGAPYPAAVAAISALPGAGYSHRITRTFVPNRYVGVWVQGPEGSQDVYYKVFTK
jgi:hypothetical protein